MQYQWMDAAHTTIKVTDDDGNEYFVPTDPANRHYAQILEEQVEVEEADAPAQGGPT